MRAKNKYVFSFLGILLIACVLNGCKPMSKENDMDANWEEVLGELKEKAPNEVESHISVEISENFILDADISISDELDTYSLEEVKMYRHIFEDEEKETILQRVMDETGWCGPEQVAQAVFYDEGMNVYENGKTDDTLILEYEDKIAWVGDLDISASNGEFSELYGKFSANLFPSTTSDGARDYIEIIKEPAELDFMSVKEAETYVKEFAESFGIEFQCDTIPYVCTLERLEKIEELMEENKKQYTPDYEAPDLTAAGEAYGIVLQQGYKGVPLFPYDLSKSETNTIMTGTRCYAFCSADGIEELSLQYVFDIKEGIETKEILSIGEILESYCEQYGNPVGLKEKIIKVQLHYLPVLTDEETSEFIAKPIWFIFSNVERDTPQRKSITRRATVYDAVTGETLAW